MAFLFLIAPLAMAAGIDPASTITADPTSIIPASDQTFVLNWFLHYAVAHSWLASVLIVMAFCRTWAKPVFSFVQGLLATNPNSVAAKDVGAVVTWFATNPIGKTLAFVIDWVTSIKIVPPASQVAINNAAKTS